MNQPDPKKIAAAARAFDQTAGPLTFERHLDVDDVYLRATDAGNVLIVIPGMRTSMPDTLLNALRARRTANVTGRCPACQGVADAARDAVDHEHFCTATDDRVGPMLESWSRQVGLYARGRRIVEDPEQSSPGANL